MIFHILKDGSQVDDIEGKVIHEKEIYLIIQKINGRGETNEIIRTPKRSVESR